MNRFLRIFSLTIALLMLAGHAQATGAGTTQSVWGSAYRGPATGTMRFPVDISSSSAPGYLAVSDLQSLFQTNVNCSLSAYNGILSTAQCPIRGPITGTTDTITASDAGKIIIYNSASAVAVTSAGAATTGLTQGFGVTLNNFGTGTVTWTPTGSTINGASSFAVPANTGCYVYSDNTNFRVDLSACNSLTGASGTPGGSSGQIQYNSNGIFAGVTVSTGLSFNSTTGTLTASGGGGNVTGAGTTTQNAVATWGNTNGTSLQNSPLTVSSDGTNIVDTLTPSGTVNFTAQGTGGPASLNITASYGYMYFNAYQYNFQNNGTATFSGPVYSQQGVFTPVLEITSSTAVTLTSSNYTVGFNSASTHSVTLPACTSSNAGQMLELEDEGNNSSTYNDTITAPSGTKLKNVSAGSITLNANGSGVTLRCTGSTTNWMQVN